MVVAEVVAVVGLVLADDFGEGEGADECEDDAEGVEVL